MLPALSPGNLNQAAVGLWSVRPPGGGFPVGEGVHDSFGSKGGFFLKILSEFFEPRIFESPGPPPRRDTPDPWGNGSRPFPPGLQKTFVSNNIHLKLPQAFRVLPM